jgi:hypothetical protein
MKKAELEQHDNAYQALMYKANGALRSNLHSEAIEFAVSAWDHIDGMIQYQRRFADKEVSSIQAIDIVLHYAPLLMDFETLDRLEALLHSQKRISKSTGIDWDNRLAKARAEMWEAHQFWTCLEDQGAIDESSLANFYGDHRKHWRPIAEGWVEMGLVFRVQSGNKSLLSLVTDLNQIVLAKCPSCAAIVKGRKSGCLEEHHCPKCHQKHSFVVLAKSPANPA